MAAKISSTRNLVGHFDVLEKLEAIHKAVEAKSAPRALNYVEATEVLGSRLPKGASWLQEDAKKIEKRIKMREKNLKVCKPKRKLPTVMIRDVVKNLPDYDR
ncbi:hypothetical protein EVAR_82518_1 [Eumeta japonica]|uniref:Uncharacterized protein n=1 Tax=Eumeta variegata TaxID=151549 RepID=A0A4C1UXN6_EUMVA|nr:hypothetical protein EVAR_82518_1 [Eumeta japonica]